jgi:hypothetical protein
MALGSWLRTSTVPTNLKDPNRIFIGGWCHVASPDHYNHLASSCANEFNKYFSLALQNIYNACLSCTIIEWNTSFFLWQALAARSIVHNKGWCTPKLETFPKHFHESLHYKHSLQIHFTSNRASPNTVPCFVVRHFVFLCQLDSFLGLHSSFVEVAVHTIETLACSCVGEFGFTQINLVPKIEQKITKIST